MSAHTPLPWRVSACGDEVETETGKVICDCNPRAGDFARCVVREQSGDNAAFIVQSVTECAALCAKLAQAVEAMEAAREEIEAAETIVVANGQANLELMCATEQLSATAENLRSCIAACRDTKEGGA